MAEYKIKPKFLKPEDLDRNYRIYNACSQIFEGSPVTELFEHIAALTELILILQSD